MHKKTTLRLAFSFFLAAALVLMHATATRAVNTQAIFDRLTSKVSDITETAETAQVTQAAQERLAQNPETLEETAQKSIEQVKKYLDPSRVQGVLKEMFSNHYGIVGEVQRINDDALTVRNVQGTTILSLGAPDITITRDKEKIQIKDIAVGNWVALLGYKEGEDFAPKAVLVSADSPRPKPQLVVLGTITEISTKSVTVLNRATAEERTFAFTRTSNIQDSAGDSLRLADVDVDTTALVVATTDDASEDYEVVTLRSLTASDASN